MSVPVYALLFLSIMLSVVAQLLMKAGMMSFGQLVLEKHTFILTFFRILMNPHVFAGLSCLAVSFMAWLVILSKVEVSLAYPMLSLGYIFNAIAARYFFSEPLSFLRILGILVIVCGVVLLSHSTSS